MKKVLFLIKLEIKPPFEGGKFFFANGYLTLEWWTDGDGQFPIEIWFCMVYSINTKDDLPIGTEKAVGIELLHQFVE